jgi:hypothetical protein
LIGFVDGNGMNRLLDCVIEIGGIDFGVQLKALFELSCDIPIALFEGISCRIDQMKPLL